MKNCMQETLDADKCHDIQGTLVENYQIERYLLEAQNISSVIHYLPQQVLPAVCP
jgi:hypothetical protein